LAGIDAVLHETPLQPVVGTSRYDAAHEEAVIYEMLSWRPSGLIVAGLEHTEASRAMMRAAGIPIVEMMDIDGPAVAAAVGISHEEAGRQMAREVVARGYRRIAYLGAGSPGDHRARKRLAGFEEVLGQAGISLIDRMFYEGNSGFGTGREMTKNLLSQNSEVDFLYYNSDLNAAGGLLYCLEKGVDVPGTIGLAGFNAFEMLMGLPMRLATTDSRRNAIGRAAAEVIASGELSETLTVLEPVFDAGETVRPRPNDPR
ncbi:MAG: substrate-binding domain-containing protein, partial [Pseudomonadota bacterium]